MIIAKNVLAISLAIFQGLLPHIVDIFAIYSAAPGLFLTRIFKNSFLLKKQTGEIRQPVWMLNELV